ncbi:hypothetical protein EO98_10515 [Methanosarcina sp. 2.H.T.1A.6]|uniref:DUF1616 domain-containing protein n=1 Tax=unclassified Methanosarcina TaxID=2644672 RepID=UPI000621BD30|nr:MULTISPECIES: DUF1616 domain-containing protein [unclassified Methanosarcina]KKG15906.1 hypothetical protein EO97_04265 [Methanosarcina sp. 2.H.T.1A.15]KKG17473.1 hypothetical protein EO94_10055 [Methanosarcina sp. 2.H.T.1A.3]KKG23302.1 hypothetical protein EO98_10515 [Methanosarcina sp. 2.H.T.1A.6]KKG25878.1 hypothetical protein EO96_11115 [Methanosarcina sp. 2.H.T.1A.8]
MPHLKKCVFVDDLLAVTLLSCLGAVFVLVPPFNETFLRIPIALSLFFFVPGYAFISALFPGNKEISGIERFTLSVGFSLILTVFDGFLISLLPWGYRPAPIVVSILGITTFFSILAIFTRKLRDESEQFSFSLKEFIRSIQSDELDETPDESEEISAATENRRFHRSRSKVKAKGLKYQPGTETKTEARKKPLPPEIEKALVIALIGSIIISSAMLAYAKMTREKETFTMLYLLGPDGKAEGYPNESLINVPITVTVGIENHELQSVNYILQMKIDGEVIEELNVPIKDEESWQKNLTYTRHKLKSGRSKLEFALYKNEVNYFSYRSVHLYIENNNTFSHLNDEKYTDASALPKIKNGEMEFSTGWNFTSNTENIKGSYINGSGVDSSSAYRIGNSYEGNTSDFSVEFGEIYQNIECKEDTMAVLSAYVNDSFNSNSQGADAQLKYVTFNGETIWSDGISEDEGWQHLEVPIALQAGKNNLTLGLNQLPGEIVPVEVLWDSISLKPLADLSSYVSESNTVETVPPTSSVLELPAYTDNKTFTVSWNGTDEGSGIAYYSIDSSTDGVNWETWIPKTTDNSSTFTGEHNQTYYFRSKAVDNAGNEEPEHPVPDTQTEIYTGVPKVTLDISPNPCKTATTFTVTYPVTLQSVVCLVTRDGFETESNELTSSDGINWIGNYIVRNGDHFYVEAVCTDIFGNTVSTFDEILVDSSIPDFEIEIKPKIIDTGDLEIKVTPSTTLKSKPSVSVSANEKVSVTYLSYSDGAYFYEARIKSEINEGDHKVSVTGYDLESEKVEGNTTFVVDHSG